MGRLLKRRFLIESLREMGPAFIVLVVTLIISTFITEFAFTSGVEALWRTLFRFLRLSLILSFPLMLLPSICSLTERFFNRGNRHLIQIQETCDTYLQPSKHWLIRPFQGIGLAMLSATKFLAFLEIYTGSRVHVDVVFPPRDFYSARFFSVIAIVAFVSLLLSFLWTLDDLEVRNYNKKTNEIKMIGRRIGLLLPISFGLYGMFSLFKNYAQLLAVQIIAQMVIILYPPFVILSVLHLRYLRKRGAVLLQRLKPTPGAILLKGEKSVIHKV